MRIIEISIYFIHEYPLNYPLRIHDQISAGLDIFVIHTHGRQGQNLYNVSYNLPIYKEIIFLNFFLFLHCLQKRRISFLHFV
jgi:hypothetical protein